MLPRGFISSPSCRCCNPSPPPPKGCGSAIGDGWLVVPIPTLDQLAKQMLIYSSARSAAQLPPSPHVCRLLEVGCTPDDDTAVRRIAPFLIEKYKAYFSWGLEGLSLDPNATPEQQFRSLAANRFAGRRAGQGDRHAACPAPRRRHPPVDAGELARNAPGRHPLRHRAVGPRSAAAGAAMLATMTLSLVPSASEAALYTGHTMSRHRAAQNLQTMTSSSRLDATLRARTKRQRSGGASRSSSGCGRRTASRTVGATGRSAMPPSAHARCSRRAHRSSSARKWRRPSSGRPPSAMAGW
jgi:hypothetical protein